MEQNALENLEKNTTTKLIIKTRYVNTATKLN